MLKVEAEVLTKNTIPDLELYNWSVEELGKYLYGDIEQRISPGKRSRLLPDRFYQQQVNYVPRFLFKLSEYKNESLGTLWVAYLSRTNPSLNSESTAYHEAFFATFINDEIKIIGAMSVGLSESDMTPVGWRPNVYNPPEINIEAIGNFISTERYLIPEDDGFSRTDYMEEK